MTTAWESQPSIPESTSLPPVTFQGARGMEGRDRDPSRGTREGEHLPLTLYCVFLKDGIIA